MTVGRSLPAAQRFLRPSHLPRQARAVLSYTAAFDDRGWDSLRAHQDISDDDLIEAARHGRVAMKSDHAARLRRMDRLCRLCWLPQLLLHLASLTRVHGELTRRTSRMHHLSRPVPKPLRFRSSCTPSWCSRTCWRHAGRAAARQHDPNKIGV